MFAPRSSPRQSEKSRPGCGARSRLINNALSNLHARVSLVYRGNEEGEGGRDVDDYCCRSYILCAEDERGERLVCIFRLRYESFLFARARDEGRGSERAAE